MVFDLPIGFLFVLAITSGVYGIVLAGFLEQQVRAVGGLA
jgi:hypothetical protein